jgi:hypothetical protein
MSMPSSTIGEAEPRDAGLLAAPREAVHNSPAHADPGLRSAVATCGKTGRGPFRHRCPPPRRAHRRTGHRPQLTAVLALVDKASRNPDAISRADIDAVRAVGVPDEAIADALRVNPKQLGSYGKPVMVSHLEVWGDAACQADTFKQYADVIFTDSSLGAMINRDHLFAFDFRYDDCISDPASYAYVKLVLARHAAPGW